MTLPDITYTSSSSVVSKTSKRRCGGLEGEAKDIIGEYCRSESDNLVPQLSSRSWFQPQL